MKGRARKAETFVAIDVATYSLNVHVNQYDHKIMMITVQEELCVASKKILFFFFRIFRFNKLTFSYLYITIYLTLIITIKYNI